MGCGTPHGRRGIPRGAVLRVWGVVLRAWGAELRAPVCARLAPGEDEAAPGLVGPADPPEPLELHEVALHGADREPTGALAQSSVARPHGARVGRVGVGAGPQREPHVASATLARGPRVDAGPERLGGDAHAGARGAHVVLGPDVLALRRGHDGIHPAADSRAETGSGFACPPSVHMSRSHARSLMATTRSDAG